MWYWWHIVSMFGYPMWLNFTKAYLSYKHKVQTTYFSIHVRCTSRADNSRTLYKHVLHWPHVKDTLRTRIHAYRCEARPVTRVACDTLTPPHAQMQQVSEQTKRRQKIMPTSVFVGDESGTKRPSWSLFRPPKNMCQGWGEKCREACSCQDYFIRI